MIRNLLVIMVGSLLMGVLGGGIFMFMRSKLRVRRRKMNREEMERLVAYSEYRPKIDIK